MPKISEHPRLRSHTKTGAKGQTWTSYYWDGRSRNAKDVALGSDYEEALARWAICEAGGIPPPLTRPTKPKPVKLYKKRLEPRQVGKRRKFGDEVWAGLPNWAKSFYLNAERRSQDDRKAFWLVPADLAEIIQRANGRCEVSGVPLRERQPGERTRHPHSPSIDRIDSSRGYVRGNVRVVCLIANFAMSNWGEGALRTLAAHVSGNGDAEISATSL